MRDTKIMQLSEGTSQVHRLVLARERLRAGVSHGRLHRRIAVAGSADQLVERPLELIPARNLNGLAREAQTLDV